MVAVTADGVGRFDMGRVVQRTFSVLSRNLTVFIGLALVLSILPQVLFALFTYAKVMAAAQSGVADPGAMLGAIPKMMLGMVVAMICGAVLQTALVHGTVADLNGKPVTFGAALSTGLNRLLPVIGLALLSALAIGAASMLLIVPGVILAVLWCVATPVLVVERTGVFAAFGRSARLTEGSRWMIFGLMVAYLVAIWLVTLVSGAIGGIIGLALGSVGVIVNLLVQQVVMGLVSLVGTAGGAVIYYELRSTKEGVGAEALASVFD
ncbi:hypothetical protein [Caulobacter sp. 17J80-11]|uniref:hypothetical protein n=1 Tax=Caulobacter sp. 17J80-11 TaxID=2763502 RepID=UPI001653C0D8|nr:hypothetical protein [Caulobacter sp. 17J80-11]MBC6981876.1 hypothetical protein [Caulobacter sp. 17J80-11]